jgi:hypothetical protein
MLVRSLSLGETDKLHDRIYGRGGSPVHYVRMLATLMICVCPCYEGVEGGQREVR